MAKNITRREAAKTIAIATGATFITPAAMANSDACLVALEADWAQAMRDLINEFHKEPMNETLVSSLHDRLPEIERAITETPANSLVGIGVKLRIFHWFMQDHEYSDDDMTGELMHSIRRDLGETFYQYPSVARA